MRNNATLAMGTSVMLRAASLTLTDTFFVRNVGPTYANAAALFLKTRTPTATSAILGGVPRIASKRTMDTTLAHDAARTVDMTTPARPDGTIEKKPDLGGGLNSLTKENGAFLTQAHLRLHPGRTMKVDGTHGTRLFRRVLHFATGGRAHESLFATPNLIRKL